VQETMEKVKMIQEKMKASQSRHKSYHDKRRKDIEFQVGVLKKYKKIMLGILC